MLCIVLGDKCNLKKFLNLYLPGQMRREVAAREGPVHSNKWFCLSTELGDGCEITKSKPGRNYPSDPVEQKLLGSCGRLKEHVFFFFFSFSSTTSKTIQESDFPQKPGVGLSQGAAGACGREKWNTMDPAAPCLSHMSLAGTSFEDGSALVCHYHPGSAQQPRGAFLGVLTLNHKL